MLNNFLKHQFNHKVNETNRINKLAKKIDKHFKEKARLKKQKQMMGGSEEELREKIAEMELNQGNIKFVNVKEYNKNKQKHKEEQYI